MGGKLVLLTKDSSPKASDMYADNPIGKKARGCMYEYMQRSSK